MKWIEWLLILSSIIVGLSCLTMSATMLSGPPSFQSYLNTLINICMWTGIPLIITAVLYLIFKWKKSGNNRYDE